MQLGFAELEGKGKSPKQPAEVEEQGNEASKNALNCMDYDVY